MKRTSKISIELPSKKMVEILLKALLPETRRSVTSRSKVFVEGIGKRLVIKVQAKDLTALRATLNSYLRWVTLIVDICRATEQTKADQCENT